MNGINTTMVVDAKNYFNTLINSWTSFFHIYNMKDSKNFFKDEVIEEIKVIEYKLLGYLDCSNLMEYLEVNLFKNVRENDKRNKEFNLAMQMIILLKQNDKFTYSDLLELQYLIANLTEMEPEFKTEGLNLALKQSQVNTLMGKNGWRLNSKMNYINAVLEETGELLESTKYHWWKKAELTKKDEMNQVTEFIDIFHFILSLSIRALGIKETHEIIENMDVRVAESLLEQAPIEDFELYNFELLDKYDFLAGTIANACLVHTDLKRISLNLWNINKLNYNAIEKDFHLNSAVIKTQIQDMFLNFLLLGLKLDLSYNDIQKLYVLKATLNIVRNKNGYKEGTYNKTWSLDGERLEDNYVVFGAKDQFQEVFENSYNPFEDAEDFVQGLYDKYGKIKKVD
jgi:dimeric dUTPase (all-alpha-NTP-PPase superfamily)